MLLSFLETEIHFAAKALLTPSLAYFDVFYKKCQVKNKCNTIKSGMGIPSSGIEL